MTGETKTRLIHPTPNLNPNIPEGVEHVHIPRHSLYNLLTVTSCLVLPERIDEERLEKAIERLGGVWSLISGRLVYRESGDDSLSNFAIKLTNSPIPLEIETIQDETDYPLPNTNVVQPSLEGYITPLELTYPIPDSDTPLTTFKLTHVNTRSVLGVCSSHGIIDGFGANRLLHDLSRLYTHPESIVESVPTFGPSLDVTSLASGSVSAAEGPEKVHSEEDDNGAEWGGKGPKGKKNVEWYEPIEISDMFMEVGQSSMESENVNLILTREEIDALKRFLIGQKGVLPTGLQNGNVNVQGGHNDTGTWLSDQDVLSAWWISLLTRIGAKVDGVWYAVNYRDLWPLDSRIPKELKTNHLPEIQFTHFPISNSASAHSTANEIRKGIGLIKYDPEDWVRFCDDAGRLLELGAESGKGLRIVPKVESCVVNSNLKYEWTPDYGQKGGETRYHTEHSCRRFLRVFRANRGLVSDGSSEAGNWDGSVELAFQISRSVVGEFEQLVRGDKASWHL